MMNDTQKEAFWQAYKTKLDSIIAAFNKTYGTSVTLEGEVVNNKTQYNCTITFADAYTIATFREQIGVAGKYFTDRGVSYYVYDNGELVIKIIFMLDSEAIDSFKFNLEASLQPYLKALGSQLLFDAGEVNTQVNIFTNQDITVELPDFVTQDALEQDKLRREIYTLKFNVAANDTGEIRTGNIVIKNTGSTLTWSISVAQEG